MGCCKSFDFKIFILPQIPEQFFPIRGEKVVLKRRKKKGVGEVATATTTATLSAAVGTWGPDAVKCNEAVPESDFSKVV